MATIVVSPGVSGQFPILTLKVGNDTTGLPIPMLQDITIENNNDTFTWTQLNSGSKFQVATTATNSISGNMVLDDAVFFGVTTAGEVAKTKGVFGLSKDKSEVNFTISVGAKTLAGKGYVTGLSPSVSADSPVFVSPITISVTGDYTVS
jgi:hypothetical protein